MADRTVTVVLKGNVKPYLSEIDKAEKATLRLRDLMARTEATVHADVTDALGKLNQVTGKLNALDGKTARTRVDVDTGSAVSKLDGLAAGAAKSGALVGKSMESGFGVISRAGPAHIAIAAAAFQLLPTAAGVAAAGIVTVVGGALAAVGITAAAQSDKVRDAWSQLGEDLRAELADVAEPFEGSLLRAADVAERTFQRLKPSLARIFEDLVPDVDRFIAGVGEGIARLGPHLERIGDSFGKVLTELGKRMPVIMDNIGEAFDTFSAMMDDDPQMLANLIDDATQLLAVGAEVLAWADDISAAFQFVTTANPKPLVDKILGGSPQEQLAHLEQLPKSLAEMRVAVQGSIDALEGIGSSARDGAAGVRSLNDALEEFFQPAQNALAAQNDWKEALVEAATALEKGNVSTLDRGRHLENLLGTLAKNAQAERDATGATERSTAAFEKNIGSLVRMAGSSETGRAALDGLAESLGFTIDRIGNATIVTDKFGNRVRVLPNGKVVKIEAKTDEADRKLKGTKSNLDALKNKTVVVTVRTERQEFAARASWQKEEAGGINRYAAGGVHAFASGGMAGGSRMSPPPHIADQPTILYGEGNGPEAFIPYDPVFRPRAEALLSQVADDFGGRFVPAAASLTNSSRVSSPQMLRGASYVGSSAVAEGGGRALPASGGASLITVQEMNVTSRSDADAAAAYLYARLGSKGP